MYSRNKGKSGSTRPTKKSTPSWVRYKSKEIELLIIKLAKEGNTTSEIGIILRDAYGVPNVKNITKKSISDILKDKKLLKEVPEDLMAIIKRNIAIRNHLQENKQDKVAKRGLQLAEAKIKRLVDYYKKTKKLSKDWKYDPEKIRLLIE